ncbi:aminopeptidase Y [Spinellus fusiger]|nr:aminopeptidase Y [Spinellus fusiger]
MRLFTAVAIVTSLFIGVQGIYLPSQTPFQIPASVNHPAQLSTEALSLSKQLQNGLTLEGLLRHSRQLQKIADANQNTRVFGSKGHNETLEYVRSYIEERGYNTWIEPMILTYTEAMEQSASILFPSTVDPKITVRLMTYTTSTPPKGLVADLVAVKGLACEQIHQSLEGKIALVQRGQCAFGEKSYYAAQAGASALLIYNTEESTLSGTLGQDFSENVPTGGISRSEGERLIQLLEDQKKVVLRVQLIEKREPRHTYNIIAETKGGNKENKIVLGGHSDSVAAGPGINDNGSGTAAMLAMADVFQHHTPKNAVRFCWWTAEEFGLRGSNYHVAHLSPEEQKKIALYLNFDMIASPNYINGIYDGDGSDSKMMGPAGSAAIETLFQNFFESEGEEHQPSEFDGRSDYGAFVKAGIPSGGLFTGAEVPKTPEEVRKYGGVAGVAYDECYHQSCDTIDNLNKHAFLLHSRAIAHALAVFSESTASVDKQRNTTVAVSNFSVDWPPSTPKGTYSI